MTETQQDMKQWLAAAHAGSSEALGRALESCRNYLLLIAHQDLDPALQGKGGPSDLVQETFLEAQRDFAQFYGDEEAELRAWLRRLLLNNVADFMRRYQGTEKRQARREVPLEADVRSGHRQGNVAADVSSPSGQAQQHEQADALREALARLPGDYRQVLVARYEEERSFEEIARRMQRSPNAVRKLWARALERLEQEMETSP
jgi:RNA polymerase sigma-70 factor, ECF subfamily